MRFSVWFENIESSSEVVGRISAAIEAASDYDSAVRALVGLGAESPSQTDWLGSLWEKSIYDLIASPGEGKADARISGELQRYRKEIGSLPGVRALGVDVNNPWNSFVVEADGRAVESSNVKIHLRVGEDDMEGLLRAARVVSSRRDLFRQFKYSYSSESFTKRRDNMVLYLTRDGQRDVKKILEMLSGVGLKGDLGEDETVEVYGNKEQVSQTERMAYRLAAQLISKRGAPIRKMGNGEPMIWKTTGKALSGSDPVVAHYTSIASGASGSGGGGPGQLTLSSVSGGTRPVRIGINTSIGKSSIEQMMRGDDTVRFWADPQFSVEKGGDGWYLSHAPGARNMTTVNGSPVSGKVRLVAGDSISLQGKSGKQVTPIKVLSN